MNRDNDAEASGPLRDPAAAPEAQAEAPDLLDASPPLPSGTAAMAPPAYGMPPTTDAEPVSAEGPSPPIGPERLAMAWPPASWERAPGHWRPDVEPGPEPWVLPWTAPEPADEAASPAPSRHRGRRLLREVVETVVLTLVIFWGIKLLVQNFQIEGVSMEPTLHDGQYLLVNRLLSYGLFQPSRGDIVVFRAWGERSAGEEDFIKRVIGVPGDTIEIRDQVVYVNNLPFEEPYLDTGNRTMDRVGPITLGPDEVYVMGDNRGNSTDSRTYGPLKVSEIIGKAWISFWPLEEIGLVPDGASSFARDRGG
jgi:signal peptidase I